MDSLKHAISEHPFLRSLAPAYLEILGGWAEERSFKAGEIIFREGEVADRLYLIEQGKVTLEALRGASTPLTVQELGADDVLGWSWLFPPYMCHFQARALEATRAI